MTKKTILIIDTSYGLTVGIAGHEPLYDPDSRSHVEHIQPLVSRAAEQAGIKAADITDVVAGIGPAPFTGLRAGVVAARATAFALNAKLSGTDILSPQAVWAKKKCDRLEIPVRYVLSVNDARRRQLYFSLYDAEKMASEYEFEYVICPDIDYPDSIAQRVCKKIEDKQNSSIAVVGHGVGKYEQALKKLPSIEFFEESSAVHESAEGLKLFADIAINRTETCFRESAEPMYLRRPDVEKPGPVKSVLPLSAAEKKQ